MRISCANTHFLNNAFDFCAGGQGSLCIQRIKSIENEAAVGARQTVQSEGIPILLKKSPHLCLFPAPAPSQGFQCQSGAKSPELNGRRQTGKRIAGLLPNRVAPEVQPCI